MKQIFFRRHLLATQVAPLLVKLARQLVSICLFATLAFRFADGRWRNYYDLYSTGALHIDLHIACIQRLKHKGLPHGTSGKDILP